MLRTPDPAQQSRATPDFGFDTPLDRTGMCTKKWEMEQISRQDSSLLCFGTAEMDFQTAPPIKRAFEEIVSRGHFGYPEKPESYYQAITDFFERHYDWKIERSWLNSHKGVYPSMQPLIRALSNSGDEVIYQTPVHHIFEELIRANDRVPLANPLIEVDGRYTMDFDGLAEMVTKRTKLLLLCNPHNPVGRVWDREELTRLQEFCLEHGIVVITDEVYFGLVHGDVDFIPAATISKEASMNTITLTSVSKSFNLTGTKHSLFIAENPAHQQIFQQGLVQANLNYGQCIFGLAATEVALRDCDDWRAALMDYIWGNYRVIEALFVNKLPLVKITQPEATYFAWIDLRSLGLSYDEIKNAVDNEARIALVYGEALGPGGEGHVRVNMATARSTLVEGMTRMADALKKHLKN